MDARVENDKTDMSEGKSELHRLVAKIDERLDSVTSMLTRFQLETRESFLQVGAEIRISRMHKRVGWLLALGVLLGLAARDLNWL